MKFGVITFPGSNCDYDTYAAVKFSLGEDVEFLWHADSDLRGSDVVILPGGFSYGDYLRTGSIARFSPIMKEVIRFARDGGTVWGICNGFQILLEAGLLPGAMLRNKNLKFICKYVHIRVETTSTILTGGLVQGDVIKIPIAHSDGNYYIDKKQLNGIIERDEVLFRYCTPEGELTEEANPNGSLSNIAGICNRERNVFGMMPHPERCTEEILGSSDGLRLFASMRQHFCERMTA
jgi:phosphoribosylformylglycinamidine synthase I